MKKKSSNRSEFRISSKTLRFDEIFPMEKIRQIAANLEFLATLRFDEIFPMEKIRQIAANLEFLAEHFDLTRITKCLN